MFNTNVYTHIYVYIYPHLKQLKVCDNRHVPFLGLEVEQALEGGTLLEVAVDVRLQRVQYLKNTKNEIKKKSSSPRCFTTKPQKLLEKSKQLEIAVPRPLSSIHHYIITAMPGRNRLVLWKETCACRASST